MRLWLVFLLTILTSYNYPDLLYTAQLPEVVVTAKHPIPRDKKDDWLLLARCVCAESENQSFEGQRAVADVVMNTAQDKSWTVPRTIYSKGRFDGVHTERFNRKPTESCKEAARLSMLGDRILPENVMYFFNPRTSTDKKWIRYISQFRYKQIDEHLFCYKPK